MRNVNRVAVRCCAILILFVFTKSYAGNNKPEGNKPGQGQGSDKNFPSLLNSSANSPLLKKTADSIYDLISLGQYGLEKEVFFNAYKGFEYLNGKRVLNKQGLITICDYSQSSINKRLYVIDIVNSRLLFNTYVTHGRNSGDEFATSFSNYQNSNKSCLGFLVTGGTYNGVAGLSMKFDGMEPGINDHVKSRAIVLHGSRFVSASVFANGNTISKSLGCPAVPYGIHSRIIDAIKGGSCFFIYHPDQWYTHTSKILNAAFDLLPAVQVVSKAIATPVADVEKEVIAK